MIPFNPVNLSLWEAESIYDSFGAALMKTGAYTVVGREEIAGALAKMDMGLFDCTREECAAAVAQAASAGQSIVGELVNRAGNYVLAIQLIEVSTGRILYIDALMERSLESMRQSMELFAYKLAGLTVMSGKETRIAQEFGEVFVETVPPRAEIFVNGVKRGVSPDLIRRVPLGRVRLQAQSGVLCGGKEVEITRSLQQVRLELIESPGSLQVSTKERLDVLLDGIRLDPVEGNLFHGLIPGYYTLELRGKNTYWRDEVVILPNERTQIVAQLLPHGTIEYQIAPGAVAELRGELFREVVAGHGTLEVPAGDYSAVISGKNYEQQRVVLLSVAPAEITLLRPNLKFSRAYEAEQFSRQIEEARHILDFGYRLTSSDIRKLEDLGQTIAQSKHDFPELVAQVESLLGQARTVVAAEAVAAADKTRDAERKEQERRLNELLSQRQGLEVQIETLRLAARRKHVGGWISLGAGLTFGGIAGLCYYMGNDAYADYLQLAESGRLDLARQKEVEVRLWDISAIAALGVGGACAGVSMFFWFSAPSTRRLRLERESLNREINMLEDSLH